MMSTRWDIQELQRCGLLPSCGACLHVNLILASARNGLVKKQNCSTGIHSLVYSKFNYITTSSCTSVTEASSLAALAIRP
jgi:hypothetical protein